MAAPGGSTWVDQVLSRGARPGTFAYGSAGEYGYVYVLRSAGDHSFVLHTFDLDTYPTSAGGSVDSLVAGASAYYRRPTLQPDGTDESTLNVRTGGGTWKGLTAEEMARLDGFLLGGSDGGGSGGSGGGGSGGSGGSMSAPAGGSSLDSGSSGDGAKLGEPVLSRMAAILAGLGATDDGSVSGTSRFSGLGPSLESGVADGGGGSWGDDVQHAGDSVESPGLLSSVWSTVAGAASYAARKVDQAVGVAGTYLLTGSGVGMDSASGVELAGAALQGWNEHRIQPLADRLQAKVEFRNLQGDQGDPGFITELALGVEDMIGAKIPEAYYGADLTGKQIPGDLLDGGERTQHLLFGIADAAGTVAASGGMTSKALGLGPKLPGAAAVEELEQAAVGRIIDADVEVVGVHGPKGARGPATAWSGWDEAAAGGPVRDLTTNRIRVTDRGIAVVEQHTSRFGNKRGTGIKGGHSALIRAPGNKRGT